MHASGTRGGLEAGSSDGVCCLVDNLSVTISSFPQLIGYTSLLLCNIAIQNRCMWVGS